MDSGQIKPHREQESTWAEQRERARKVGAGMRVTLASPGELGSTRSHLLHHCNLILSLVGQQQRTLGKSRFQGPSNPKSLLLYCFFLFLFFETGFLRVALAVLELTELSRVNIGIKGVHYHTRFCLFETRSCYVA